MKKKRLFRNEDGFTLIEIIAVLVILGILAAVAVPKYFDLQTKAREKAVYTAISELKVRVNQHFASQLLDGFVIASITYTADSVGLDIGADFAISNWVDGASTITFDITYFPDPSNPTKNPLTKSETIAKPQTD